MELQQIEHKLVWYKKHGDNFMGECTLDGMTLSDLQHLFEQSSDDPMIYCYPVLFSHISYIQNFVKHKINLDSFDYFIEI
jgi:hypothetical protein